MPFQKPPGVNDEGDKCEWHFWSIFPRFFFIFIVSFDVSSFESKERNFQIFQFERLIQLVTL